MDKGFTVLTLSDPSTNNVEARPQLVSSNLCINLNDWEFHAKEHTENQFFVLTATRKVNTQ